MSVSSTSLFSVAYVTAPTAAVATALAKHLVSSSTCACVNIIPSVTSVYKWKGEICEDSEQLLIIKTKTNMIANLIEEVRKNHPYEVPEIIAVPITNGNEAYLKWIDESIK